MKQFVGKHTRGALTLALVASLFTVGCGGTSLAPRSIYGPDIPIGNGVGRSVVVLDEAGVPTGVGLELTPAALAGHVMDRADITTQFFVPLPPQASGTPYVTAVLAHSSGHVPPASGVEALEPAHFHAVFLMNPPRPPQNPPVEDLPVAASEIPQDHVRVGEIVPVLGSNYDDPSVPVGYPAKATLGQNVFFSNGHMNAMHVGESVEFLAGKLTRSGVIKQPQVFPKPGLYPNQWSVHFDAQRQTHVFMLTNFQRAQQTL